MSKKKLELAEGESVVREEGAMFLKSAINAKSGRLVLTDRRLVFLHKRVNLFGLIGALLMSKEGRVLLEIPLPQIEGWSQSTHGRSDHVVALSVDGESLRFLVNKPYDEWDSALSAARN